MKEKRKLHGSQTRDKLSYSFLSKDYVRPRYHFLYSSYQLHLPRNRYISIIKLIINYKFKKKKKNQHQYLSTSEN